MARVPQFAQTAYEPPRAKVRNGDRQNDFVNVALAVGWDQNQPEIAQRFA
jgi:hypothetical protein